MSPILVIFYFLSFKLIAASLGVVFSRNPIYSVLCLIVAFLDASALFLLLGAEFLAFILAIVYVGAVAVLFLFVVMMFDVSFDKIKERIRSFGLLALGMGLFLSMQVGTMALAWQSHHIQKEAPPAVTGTTSYTPVETAMTNTEALGKILYTDYILPFQLGGIILLLAMIGAIVLTLRNRTTLKRQDVHVQMERCPSNTLVLKKVPSKKGVSL